MKIARIRRFLKRFGRDLVFHVDPDSSPVEISGVGIMHVSDIVRARAGLDPKHGVMRKVPGRRIWYE